jgi:adenylylsulfate kinase
MRHLADGVVLAGKIAVADFICPTLEARKQFNPDYIVWMDTIKEGRFADTNKMFENPTSCDYHVKEWFTDTHQQLSEVIKNYMEKQNV